MLDGKRGHAREDGDRKVGEERVHTRSRKAVAAAGLRSFAPEMKNTYVSRGCVEIGSAT
jgi:hypothetical protein